MAEPVITQNGTQTNIKLGEKLVASNVPGLKNVIRRLIEIGNTHIEIDCSILETLDSTGIGLLIAAHNSLEKVDGRLTIVQASTDIYDLLCSMRLDRRIKISRSAAE